MTAVRENGRSAGHYATGAPVLPEAGMKKGKPFLRPAKRERSKGSSFAANRHAKITTLMRCANENQ
ncbi:hypothetical protein ABC383_04290 [Noviherbaspirillum sp. 1P10PC]|uniref:hypothetical protein n=1 Tax=Noviherbaspirillum sp. 1P10PC TaxID=3132292 RepID=UPI0039A32229